MQFLTNSPWLDIAMHKSGRNLEAVVHGVLHTVVIIIPKLGRHEDVFPLEHAHIYALKQVSVVGWSRQAQLSQRCACCAWVNE